MKSTLIPEPQLFFGGSEDSSCIDPKVGLINFGPFGRFSRGKSEHLIIRAGIISTKKSKILLESWLDKLKNRIPGRIDENSSRREVDFPGISLDSPLKFEIQIDESCVEYIRESDIDDLEKFPRKKRILEVLKIYEQKFADLASTSDPPPDIVFLPLSEKLIKLCENKKFKTGKIIYEYKTFNRKKIYEYTPLFDFHNAMKVIAFKNGNMVSQIIRPSTLNFNTSQDPATVAWNFAVATYYKATGIPWKLADIDEETCYVGLSFYQEITEKDRNMRASMAHVYLRTGESQVIRGKPFKWDENQGKHPYLTENLAYEIIKDVIELYKRQKNNALPRRIVIHKTTPFKDEEIGGFDKGIKGIEMADYIHIHQKSGIMLFYKGKTYPPIRGTFIYDKTKFILYTTGYVPSLNTYMGSSVPMPLFLEAYRMDSHPEQIAKDIMALTKLDWNNAYFNVRLPVTIGVSRKVGNILSESSARNIDAPSNYRYYM